MGGFEVLQYWLITEFLAFAIISLLSIISIKNILLRFGILKENRRDYYECGFRANNQTPIQVSFHFFIICIFFIIYDVELVFSLPIISVISFSNIIDIFNLLLIYITMIISLIYDYDKNLLEWKFF